MKYEKYRLVIVNRENEIIEYEKCLGDEEMAKIVVYLDSEDNNGLDSFVLDTETVE
jgi:hypothetical protein